MLHLERRKLALKGAYRPARFDLRLQLFHLALERPSLRVGLRHPQDFRQAQSSGLGRRLELAFAIVLLPLREHERMDVQRVSHVLRLDLRVIGQLDRLNLELKRIAMNLLRPNWCCHDTSSIVRSRCPLYRMRFPVACMPLLDREISIASCLTPRGASIHLRPDRLVRFKRRKDTLVTVGAGCAHPT